MLGIWKGHRFNHKGPETRGRRGRSGETYRKSSVKPTVGTWSSLAFGAVSTAACSVEPFSPEAPKPLRESGDFSVGKPSRGFSPVELITRWDGRTSGRVEGS